MTQFKLSALMPDAAPRAVSSSLSYGLKTRTDYGGVKRKVVYIHSWCRDDELGDSRKYLRPVYAAGNRPCAPRPPALTQAERNVTRRAKASIGRGVPNSIFALAGTCT